MTLAPSARRPARRGSGRTGSPDAGGRYGLLLLVLIVSYLLSAFNGTKLAVNLQIGLFATVLVLSLRTSPLPGRWPGRPRHWPRRLRAGKPGSAPPNCGRR